MPKQSSISDQEYLSFLLGGEEFGVDILSVQEIRVWSPVTEIPNTPDYLKGVINLRGIIVPIVDLRERFNGTSQQYSATTVVIVIQDRLTDSKNCVGLVVDAVADVHKVNTKDIKDPPDFGSKIETSFIKGMSTTEEKIIILLDSKKLLDVEEMFSQVDNLTLKAS